MAVQAGPSEGFRRISEDDLKHEVNQELYSQSDYKLERISYVYQILLIGITAVAIAFSLYTVMWLMLNDTISNLSGRGDIIGQVTLEDLFMVTSNFYFWFGFIVLTFPVGMYVFAFLVYVDMLYDSRLVEISRILSSKEKLRSAFYTLYVNKFNPILQKELERRKKINAYTKIYDDISSRATMIHPLDSYNLIDSDRMKRKARKMKRSVMTHSLQISHKSTLINNQWIFFCFHLISNSCIYFICYSCIRVQPAWFNWN